MKQMFLIYFTVFIAVQMSNNVFASDKFPVFQTSPIEIVIPTNTPGLLPDSLAEKKGSNLVYHLEGQIFTDSSQGNLQSITEGFSGSSDRSTPWKTLTELFAAYQKGSPENQIKSLYSNSQREVVNDIYKDPGMKERFQKFGLSITNMQAIAWHKTDVITNGSVAYVKFFDRDGQQSVLPYLLVKNGEQYEVASKNFDANSGNEMQNITAFFESRYATNMIH